MLGIFTVGMAFVIITGGIDLSVGSLIGLTGVIIAKLTNPEVDDPQYFHWNIYLGVAFAVGVALMIGLVQGLLITMLNLQPFIVTLAGMLILRGVSQTICKSGTLSIGDTSLANLANNGFLMKEGSAVLSWPVVIFIGVVIIFGYILHFTVLGRYIFAIGGNRDAAKYSGIKVKQIETSTYVISAGLAALAGICNASYVGGMDKGVGWILRAVRGYRSSAGRLQPSWGVRAPCLAC